MHVRNVLDDYSIGSGLLDSILIDNSKKSFRNLLFIPIDQVKEGNDRFNTKCLNYLKSKFISGSFSDKVVDYDFVVDFAVRNYKIYRSKYLNMYIAVVNDAGVENLFKLSENLRFSCSYSRKVEKRMNNLSRSYEGKNSVLLTLTVDPKRFSYNKIAMWESIKSEFNRFLTLLRYHLSKYGRVLPPYLATVEAQKNGNPHIHVVFFGAKRLLDWREIRKYWGLGHTYLNRTTEGKKVRNPVRYITKYITKAVDGSNEEFLLTQSLLWLFGIRSYSYSSGLIFPLKYPYSIGSSGNNVFLVIDVRNRYNFFDILSFAGYVLQLSAG